MDPVDVSDDDSSHSPGYDGVRIDIIMQGDRFLGTAIGSTMVRASEGVRRGVR
jgi:hypothetical protein